LWTTLCRGNAQRLPRLCFHIGKSHDLVRDTSEVFLCLDFVSDRQGKATRNEDKPDSCEVKVRQGARREEMKFMKSHLKACGACVCLVTYISPIFAQSEDSPFAELDWKKGPTTAKVGHVASQKVDSGCLFLEAADVRKFMELTQNLYSESEVGVIVSEDSSWWASYSYDDIGYVSDDEKESLDSRAILETLKKNNEKANIERRQRGWPEMIPLGWAREPHYDEKSHNLEWAVKFSSKDGIVVNYNTRILGRGGVMSVTLVCEPEKLYSVLPEFKSALRGFSYNAGNRYAEYRRGDRTAEIGLSALILGGAGAAAAKTGVFKWLWKGIVVVALAIGGFFKKIFGGGRKGQ